MPLITVHDLSRLIGEGLVEEGNREELIDGVIVRRSGRWAIESYALSELMVRYHNHLSALGSPVVALVGVTVAIPPYDAPTADLAVVRRDADGLFFGAGDTSLLVDLVRTAANGLRADRQRLYAIAGVPEYWVVDINKAEVHRFADPRDGAYRAEPPIPLAGELRSFTIPDLVIDGSGIL